LAAVMGVTLRGWTGNIHCHLDNDSVVRRATALLGGGSTGGDLLDECDQAYDLSNLDMWSELSAWTRHLHARHQNLKVTWHPGHPERPSRKGPDRSTWGLLDEAIFAADALADDVREVCAHTPTPCWSNPPQWRLLWRSSPIAGRVRERLQNVVRLELAERYTRDTTTSALSPKPDSALLALDIGQALLGDPNSPMSLRVHRAKLLANSLGTQQTCHRRDPSSVVGDLLCRACGKHLENDDHVMWSCTHRPLAAARTDLSLRVRGILRAAGLSMDDLAIGHSLWSLGPDGGVRHESCEDLILAFSSDARASAKLITAVGLLRQHCLDTSGLFLERAGFFSEAWVSLLTELGLSCEQALDTMTDIASLLAGPKGTVTVWNAFAAGAAQLRERPSEAIPSERRQASQQWRQHLEWISYMQGELARRGICDDGPARALLHMATRVMSDSDAQLFDCWLCAWTTEEAEGVTPADRGLGPTLTEAILAGHATIAEMRRSRGLKAAKAHDLTRAERGLKGLSKKRPKHAPPAVPSSSRIIDPGPLARPPPRKRKSRPDATPGAGRPRGRPRHPPPNPAPAAPAAGPPVNPGHPAPAASAPVHEKRSHKRAHGQPAPAGDKRSKHSTNPDHSDGSGADQHEDTHGTQPPRTRSAKRTRPAEAPTRDQDPKRLRESHPRECKRQASTREKKSVGTTNLEPD
jgi:hypothetical protein